MDGRAELAVHVSREMALTAPLATGVDMTFDAYYLMDDNAFQTAKLGAPRGLRCFWTSQSAARQNCPAKIINHTSPQKRPFKYTARRLRGFGISLGKRGMKQLDSVAQRSKRPTNNSHCDQ